METRGHIVTIPHNDSSLYQRFKKIMIQEIHFHSHGQQQHSNIVILLDIKTHELTHTLSMVVRTKRRVYWKRLGWTLNKELLMWTQRLWMWRRSGLTNVFPCKIQNHDFRWTFICSPFHNRAVNMVSKHLRHIFLRRNWIWPLWVEENNSS